MKWSIPPVVLVIGALAGCAARLPATLPTARPSVAPVGQVAMGVAIADTPAPVVRPTPGVTVSSGPASEPPDGPGRGFPAAGPWLVYYGQPDGLGDLDAVARQYRIFVIQEGYYDAAQITRLKAGGRNRVLAYLNLGSIEHTTRYWTSAPEGLVAAGKNKGAQIGPYSGYPDETWMNPANADWRGLLVDAMAPDTLASGADGFFFDNLEILEHGASEPNGPCDGTCAGGGYELVYQLRQKYPHCLFMQNNATSAAVRTATVNGVPYPSLLDGVMHEETFTQDDGAALAADATYTVQPNDTVIAELEAWKALDQHPGGRPFWVGTLDFVNRCANRADAQRVIALSQAHGFSPAISDKSAGLGVVCVPDLLAAASPAAGSN